MHRRRVADLFVSLSFRSGGRFVFAEEEEEAVFYGTGEEVGEAGGGGGMLD